jgi:hypothetical protein
MLAKMQLCFVCFCHADDDDHGIRRGNMARALTWWRHLGASFEATKVIAFAVNCVTFFYIIDNRIAII